MPPTLDQSSDRPSESSLIRNPHVLDRHESGVDAQRIQRMSTTAPAPSDVFYDAYNLVSKQAEEHPYLTAGALGASLVGTGLISRNYGSIARAVGRFAETTATEVRAGLGVITRGGTMADARAGLSSVARGGTATDVRAGLASITHGSASAFESRAGLASIVRESAIAADRPVLTLHIDKPIVSSEHLDKLLSGELPATFKPLTGANKFDFSLTPTGRNQTSGNPFAVVIDHEQGHFVTNSASQRAYEEFIQANSAPLKIIPHEGKLVPKSMSPKAYKVLREDGSAIYDSRSVYPLPRQGADGQFVPTDWIEPGESLSVKVIQGAIDQAGGLQKGIYITSNPRMWKGGLDGFSVFEVEIGDTASLKSWEAAMHPSLRIDTVASRVRLLRRVPNEEVAAMPITHDDHFGYGVNSILKRAQAGKSPVTSIQDLEARLLEQRSARLNATP